MKKGNGKEKQRIKKLNNNHSEKKSQGEKIEEKKHEEEYRKCKS